MHCKTIVHVSFLLLLSSLTASNAFVVIASSSFNSNHRPTKPIAMTDSNQSNNDSSSSDPLPLSYIGTWNPLRLLVLKLKFTEPSYTSPLNYEKRQGTYSCANCKATLFDSNGKYDSGSGWPSFWKTADENKVIYKKEWDGRMEAQCANCKAHLGHIFPDGPMRMNVDQGELKRIPKDDLKTSVVINEYSRLPRYCVNGASLRFTEEGVAGE